MYLSCMKVALLHMAEGSGQRKFYLFGILINFLLNSLEYHAYEVLEDMELWSSYIFYNNLFCVRLCFKFKGHDLLKFRVKLK